MTGAGALTAMRSVRGGERGRNRPLNPRQGVCRDDSAPSATAIGVRPVTTP